MEKDDCRYGFKIIDKPSVDKEGRPRVKIEVSQVMKIPAGVKDRVNRHADGSVEILRSFCNPDAASRAREAEEYAAMFERSYRFDQDGARSKLREELATLKRLGLSNDAVSRLLGHESTIHTMLKEDGGGHPYLPRVLARVTYLRELFTDTVSCVDHFLSWPMIGKRGPKSARWYRTPGEIASNTRDHMRYLVTALTEDDDY